MVAVTVSVYAVVLVIPPPDPAIIIVYVSVGVDFDVEIVIAELAVVELGLMVTLLGLKEDDAFGGTSEAERLMLFDEQPPVSVTVTVAVTLSPATIDPLLGETDIKNV